MTQPRKPIDLDLETTEIRAQAARKRLTDTIVEIQSRLKPRAIARKIANDIKETGEHLAVEAVDTVKRHPAAATGVAMSIGLLLSRSRIGRWINKRRTPATEGTLTGLIKRRADTREEGTSK